MENRSHDDALDRAGQLSTILERAAHALDASADLAEEHANRTAREGQGEVADRERLAARRARNAARRARKQAGETPRGLLPG
jgi:hypothetical protein